MEEQERDFFGVRPESMTLAGRLLIVLSSMIALVGGTWAGLNAPELGFSREYEVGLYVFLGMIPAAILFGVGYGLLSLFNIQLVRQQAKDKTDEQELDFKTPTLQGLLLFVPSIIISLAGAYWALDLGFHGWAQTLAGCLGFIPGLIVFLLGCALLSWLKIPVFLKKKREN
jgi:hypothetical protein